MNRTGIEYLNFTSNPIIGCDMTLPCAERCWARRMADRLRTAGVPQYQTVVDNDGVWTGQTAFNEAELQKLLRKRKPATIGLCFMADAFHESIPDEWLDRMFAVCALTPHLRYLILTKRPRRMWKYCQGMSGAAPWSDRVMAIRRATVDYEAFVGYPKDAITFPLPNIGLIVSASNQAELDARVTDLLATPAAMRGVSLEPLLGEVDLTPWLTGWDGDNSGLPEPLSSALARLSTIPHLDWIITGGESGPGARPMVPEWPRAIRDQCIAAGVPYLHKQNGEWSPSNNGRDLFRAGECKDVPVGDGTHHRMFRVGRKAAGRLLDGKLWDQRPEGWR